MIPVYKVGRASSVDETKSAAKPLILMSFTSSVTTPDHRLHRMLDKFHVRALH
jgi:hypothetical protein